MGKIIDKLTSKLNLWTAKYNYRIILFNIVVLSVFLLRSAGYFHPFFVISVNVIVLFSLILSIFLLNARSNSFFLAAISFWLFAAVLKILQVDVWAERTSIYVYESLVLAVIMFFLENINFSKILKRK